MKSLVIFRHAKSSWKFPVSDKLRPLNQRGFRQANEMATDCTLRSPDLIYASPAVRATTTALIYLNTLHIPASKLLIRDELYHHSSEQLVRWLRESDDKIDHLWMFGHNPSCNGLAALLLGYELENIVTCGYVSVQFDVERWSLVNKSKVKLLEFNNRERVT